jgi:hypothetical protein
LVGMYVCMYVYVRHKEPCFMFYNQDLDSTNFKL